MTKKQQGFPIIPGLFPGQRETRRSDSKTDFDLPLRQWAGVVVLLTLSFLLVVANVLIIGPILGYLVGIVVFFYVALWLRIWTESSRRDEIETVGVIVGASLFIIWLVIGYKLVELFWWDVRCTWEPRNKMLFVVFSGLFIICTSLPIYRFAQEVIDPNWSPTITIRPAEWGVLWPWKQLPRVEPEHDELEPYTAPRQTPIDEIDERYDNGTPKTLKVDWLPISPEETQKLCVAVVVEGVEFKRQALMNADAIKLNDYGPVIKVLKERRYLSKSGSGVMLTFAGYRWMCKQIPDDMTPLPYTSLGNPVKIGGKPTTTGNN